MSTPMIRYLLSRIGCFLLLVGSIFLIVGFALVGSAEPNLDALLIGSALFFGGYLLWHRFRKKEERRRRFSKFRKKPEKDEQHIEEEGRGWEDRFDD
jgi:uncharacterized membrane protein YfcA